MRNYHHKTIKNSVFLIGIIIFTIILLTIVLLRNLCEKGIKNIRAESIRIGETIETVVPKPVFSTFEYSRSDLDKAEYQDLQALLVDIADKNRDIAYIAIYKVIDNRLFTVIDTALDSIPEFDAQVQADFYHIRPQIEPVLIKNNNKKDLLSYRFSLLIPFAAMDGELFLRIDYQIRIWENLYFIQIFIIIGLILLLFLTLLFSVRILFKLKKKTNQIKEQQDLIKNFLEKLPFGIVFGENHGQTILYVNATISRIIGRSHDEITEFGWMGYTHPEDIDIICEQHNKLKSGEISSYTIQKRYIKSDDTIVWVKLSVISFKTFDSKKDYYLCIFEDITDSMLIETKFQEIRRSNSLLLSHLHGMAYRSSFDCNRTLQTVSSGCYELTGYQPEQLINNHTLAFNSFILAEYRKYIQDKYDYTVKGREIFKLEYPIKTANGEIKWVYEQGQGVVDEAGQVIALEGLIIDITNRKQRESKIEYLINHDPLTNLYNRRYFEQTIKELDCPEYFPLSFIITDINGLKKINDTLGYEQGDRTLIVIGHWLQSVCRENDVLARTGDDEFRILLPHTSSRAAERIACRINAAFNGKNRYTFGEQMTLCLSVGYATKENEDISFKNIIKTAEDKMFLNKLLENKSLHFSVLSLLKAALFARSQETEAHSLRLIKYTKKIGKYLALKSSELNELEIFSMLHDIGKIGINDNILNKPGKLDEKEWGEIKKHPRIGYQIAMATPDLKKIAPYILYHHERWDGSGYPVGLKGETIPLHSRILAVADAYDAMTEDRIYHKAISKKEAITELKDHAGTQFDPEIVRVFIEKVLKYE